MDFKRTSMAQFDDILRLIELGRSDRAIARSEKCRRTLVAQIRKGTLTKDELTRLQACERAAPMWTTQVNWLSVEEDIRDGHPIKRIWEEAAGSVTSHPNFFKYVKVRFVHLMAATVTLREFKPGEHCEVDYAGTKIPWVDIRTGEIQYAHVFVGILCFSQKIFAHAAEDEKKPNWLISHRLMFEYFGGVTCVVVPDNLKTGVVKAHLYDPDLNADYVELACHYGFSVVPARKKRPKDKALVEGAVGILLRYFRFIYRRRTFTAIAESTLLSRRQRKRSITKYIPGSKPRARTASRGLRNRRLSPCRLSRTRSATGRPANIIRTAPLRPTTIFILLHIPIAAKNSG
jgi:transposase